MLLKLAAVMESQVYPRASRGRLVRAGRMGVLILLVSLGEAAAADSGLAGLSPEEYYQAAYFQRALEHPQVKKQRSRKRQLSMVARDIHTSRKKLSQAVGKVEALGEDPLLLAKQAVMDGVKGSRVADRVLSVELNASEPRHVVMYIKWRGSRGKNAVKEAATIAAIVAKQTPLVSTLSLNAIHPKAPVSSTRSVWSAKISKGAMGRIDEGRIEGYADRMYARLFEGVKALPF